jgi:hypothetical protein
MKVGDTYYYLTPKVARSILELGQVPSYLRILASWFDRKQKSWLVRWILGWSKSTEIQDDLRTSAQHLEIVRSWLITGVDSNEPDAPQLAITKSCLKLDED